MKNDFKDLSENELLRIGEMVLVGININLFNAEPTMHKAYQVYRELVELGYPETDKVKACNKIKLFFKTRTISNHAKEFHHTFGIPFEKGMNRFLTLSFRTSEFTSERIETVAIEINGFLYKLNILHKYGVTLNVLIMAISEMYNPKYTDDEWRMTISFLCKNIKKILLIKGQGEYLVSIERVFYLIDPNQDKPRRNGNNLNELDCHGIEYGDEDVSANVLHNSQRIISSRAKGTVNEFDDTFLERKKIIKDSEVTFVKEILLSISNDIPPEVLKTDLYQNDERHPVVTCFLNSVKNYNQIMANKECSLPELFLEMKIVARSIKDLGKNIVANHEGMINKQVFHINSMLKNKI
jgi:hypothetical protein